MVYYNNVRENKNAPQLSALNRVFYTILGLYFKRALISLPIYYFDL